METYILATRETTDHTSNGIKEDLLSMIREWHLNVTTVSTDNASNITKGVSEAGLLNIRCLAHSLNLAVQKGM